MSKEALRYLRNAKEILRKAPIEENRYQDVKHVQEACGTAYLAVLKAIDEHLLSKGFSRKDLPKSLESYRLALQKHLASRNGRLLRSFDDLYDELHIAGYYRGMLHRVDAIKAIFKGAKEFIEQIP